MRHKTIQLSANAIMPVPQILRELIGSPCQWRQVPPNDQRCLSPPPPPPGWLVKGR